MHRRRRVVLGAVAPAPVDPDTRSPDDPTGGPPRPRRPATPDARSGEGETGIFDSLPEAWVPEAARDATIHHLKEACVQGLLTLGEFGRRAEAAFAARAQPDLDALTADLPDPTPAAPSLPPSTAAPGSPPRAQISVSLLGAHHQSGRWTLPARLVHISVLGGTAWDLSSALMPQPVTTITVYSLLGSLDLQVPEHVDAEVGGFSLLGGNHVDLGASGPPADAPLIRVRHFSLLGSIRLRRGASPQGGFPMDAPWPGYASSREMRRAARLERHAERVRRRFGP